MSESEPLEVFLYGIRSPETKRKYVKKLDGFFDFLELDGTREERAKKFVSKARSNNSWASVNLMKFITYQKERAERGEITASTISNYYKPLKLFLEMNDINLSWKKIARGLPRGRKVAVDRAPTIEEIRKICEYPDRRIKPIIYSMCSGAFRIGAWNFLKWKNVTPIERDGKIVAAKLVIYYGSDEQYITFISPEAFRELERWMKFREASGERISGESWLMRDLWDVQDSGHGLATVPKKLKPTGIKRMIERAIWSAGIRHQLGAGQKRHEFQAAHGLRKWFKSRAEQMMKPINVEILMGHSVGISDSYYRPNENELLNDYLNAVPLLQISEVEEVRQEFSSAEKSLKSQFEEMKQTVANMQSQLSFLTSAIVSAKTSSAQA